jgi:hypothetical protein
VGSLLLLQITEPVSSGKCGKIISNGCEWAFGYQFFAAGAPWVWISNICSSKATETSFFLFKERILHKFENKKSTV